jgi:RecA/RadA recombinase
MTKLAVKKKSKVKAKGKKTKGELRVGIIPTSFYRKAVKDTERKFSLAASALQVPYRASFGQLVFDYLSGGGIVPGIMVQISGTEGSGKSTACVVAFSSAYKERYPVLQYRDPENALSPDLIKNIIHEKPEILFSGENAPATYYDDGGLEKFYSSIKHTLKQLPDKQWDAEEKSWFFVFDADKHGREMFKAAGFTTYDKKKYEETKRLWVKTDIATPQGFIMLDSYPALLTESEDDDDDQSKAMALDARAFSKNIKRIASRLKRKGFIIVGVNQIRLKPGVMYGCFHHQTKVLLADGTSMPIGEIVDNRKKVKVWSMNKTTGELSIKPVINWFDNGMSEKGEFVKLSLDVPQPKHRSVRVTLGHKIATPTGMKPVSKLETGSKVLVRKEVVDNNADQIQLIYGAILGDGYLHSANNGFNITWSHTKKYEGYANWKRSVVPHLALSMRSEETANGLFDITATKSITDPLAVEAYTQVMSRKVDPNRKTSQYGGFPKTAVDNLDKKGFAVWYMDDGNFQFSNRNGWKCRIDCGRFTEKERAYVIQKLSVLFPGLHFTSQSSRYIAMNRKDDILRLHKILAPYIHESMAYKIHESVREKLGSYKWKTKASKPRVETVPVKVISKVPVESTYRKYDMEVGDNHTYVLATSGLVVANSPEYEPGGEALKFYSSLRFRVRKVSAPQTMPEGRTNDGNKTREFSTEKSIYGEKRNDNYVYINVVNTKNKTGTPYLRAKARILFSDGKGRMMGYDPVWDVIEYLKHTMRISGSFKKGFKMDVPALEAKMPGITKQTLDYMDLKLLVTAEATKEPELLKRVKAKFKKWTPVIRKVLFKEIHTPDKLANVILEANNKREKNSDEDEDLEA